MGTPIGSAAFTRERMMTRIADEQRLWDAIPRVPDLHNPNPMISQRNPTVANSVVESLSGDAAPQEDYLAQLHECGQTLDVRDFDGGPLGPSSPQESDHRMWQRVSLHGWQYWSSSVSDASFRKLTLLSGRTASSRAHLRSQRKRRVGALPHRTGIHHSTSSLQNIVA